MFGEIINVKIKENNKERSIVTIGTLNSIRQLIREISYINTEKKLKKLYIGKHEFFVDEISDFSLKSIGINENCECEVEFGYAWKIKLLYRKKIIIQIIILLIFK